jgi:hypothetical protein
MPPLSSSHLRPQALMLLPLLPLSQQQAAAAQRGSVAVLRRLPEFGVSLLPTQLTSLPDKHQLLQRILFGRHTYTAAAAAAASGGWAGSSVAPWRRLGDVLELAALLGLGIEDEQHEVRAARVCLRNLDVSAWLRFWCRQRPVFASAWNCVQSCGPSAAWPP